MKHVDTYTFRGKIVKNVVLYINLFLLLLTSYRPALAQDSLEQNRSNSSPLENTVQSSPSGSLAPEVYTQAAESPSPTTFPASPLTQSESAPSAVIRQPMVIHKLVKRTYQSREDVSVLVDNVGANSVSTQVYDSNGEEMPVDVDQVKTGDAMSINIHPPMQFRPGRYKLRLRDSQGNVREQDFTWGVLAINTNKSIYTPGETAQLSFAILDEAGMMVCDAKLVLKITEQTLGIHEELSTDNGGIRINPECFIHNFTLHPDYEANYTVSGLGTYNMTLTATTKNGIFTIQDVFKVENSVLFDVERKTATRIFPPKEYPVALEVIANQDFTGMITESVPGSFAIDQPENGRPFDTIRVVSPQKDEDPAAQLGDLKLALPYLDNYILSQGYGDHLKDPTERDIYARFGLLGHDGADFAMPIGTPVAASDDGEVVIAKEKWDYGTTIVIQHAWGKSYYGHLSRIDVKEGGKVTKGELIGLSGNTGLSTGPHLHFGIKPNNANFQNGFYGKIDPLPYLGLKYKSDALTSSAKVIAWNVSLKKGDKVTLGYTFLAPNVSPQFYTIGPLKFYENGGSTFVLSGTTNKEQASQSAQTIDETLQPINHSKDITVLQEKSYQFIFQETRVWQIASDAQVVIDDSIYTTSSSNLATGRSVVFTSDQIGYAFYRDSDGTAVAAKTTNGGTSWTKAFKVVDSQTDVQHVVVWYDQWTPGDTTGTYIHVVTVDNGNDDAFYTRYDTANDTTTTTIDIEDKANSFAPTSSLPNITKGTDGDLYIGVNDSGGGGDLSFVMKCTTGSDCTAKANWSDAGTLPLNSDDADDEIVMLPLSGGDILLIRYDDNNVFDSNQYTDSSATWSGWTTIDACGSTCTDHTTYEGQWGATIDKDNYKIYMAYVTDNATLGTDDLKSALYDGSWTIKTNVLTDDAKGLTSAKIALDQNSKDLYVVYTGTATATPTDVTTQSVYWKKSTDGMATWGAEQGPVNGSVDDIFGINVDMMSNERIYAAWQELNTTNPDTLEGDTIADLVPGPTLDQLMRHGKWFSNGVEQPFTF